VQAKDLVLTRLDLSGTVCPAIGSIPVVGWYIRLLRQASQPRSTPELLDRQGTSRLLFGSKQPGQGWGVTIWGLAAATLGIGTVGLALAGAWWLTVLILPVLAFVVARVIGTYREGYFS